MSVEKDDGRMVLPHLIYDWHEGVNDNDIRTGVNERLHRLSVDMLLPGATSMAQITCQVSDSEDVLKGEWKPPMTLFSARRTAVRAAMSVPGFDNHDLNDDVINHMYGSARAQACQSACEKMKKNCKKIPFEIKLPFKVDKRLCSRDDWGRNGHGSGLRIGIPS